MQNTHKHKQILIRVLKCLLTVKGKAEIKQENGKKKQQILKVDTNHEFKAIVIDSKEEQKKYIQEDLKYLQ